MSTLNGLKNVYKQELFWRTKMSEDIKTPVVGDIIIETYTSGGLNIVCEVMKITNEPNYHKGGMDQIYKLRPINKYHPNYSKPIPEFEVEKGIGSYANNYIPKFTFADARDIKLARDYKPTGLADYQKRAMDTYSEIKCDGELVYPAMGLANEAGEFLGKLKKVFRDDKGSMNEQKKKELQDELGDVLWYLTACCSVLDTTLEEIGERNIEKLQDRKARDVIGGSGDYR